jgi:SAM-dependent methyltransferase
MNRKLYEEFLAARLALEVTSESGGDVLEGWLQERSGAQRYPIIEGIPRFVPAENYSANFGLQWNRFRTTQLDSVTGLHFTFNSFWNNTGWKPRELHGRTVLEAGSGAGRFTEILLEAGARVVSFDYSSAVEANRRNNGARGELLLFQGDIYDIPLADESFDFVFCYGVLQHTPDPQRAFRALFSKLRPGGKLSIDYYRKVPYPAWYSTPKYLWRPLTTRMPPERLFRLVSGYVPVWLPVDTALKSVLFRIPRLGPMLAGLIPIPCWNHLRMGLSRQQRREWAILNTFDALGARYDRPMTAPEVEAMVSGPGREVRVSYGANGVVANVTKQPQAALQHVRAGTTAAPAAHPGSPAARGVPGRLPA